VYCPILWHDLWGPGVDFELAAQVRMVISFVACADCIDTTSYCNYCNFFQIFRWCSILTANLQSFHSFSD